MPVELSSGDAQRRHWATLISLAAFLGHIFLYSSLPFGGVPAEKSGGPSANASETSSRQFTSKMLKQYRSESMDMFRYSFDSYMAFAFPKDDLRPLSCRGTNSQGGIGLTLLDALDSLVIFNNLTAFRHAVQWIAEKASFDVDARVHVFEVTIRALGGLLSAHSLLQLEPTLYPGYDGALLRAAVDLGNRLMPAFATPTGLPLSWINLRHGQMRGDTRVTCTACAGTLLLELGVLSRLTGNITYEFKARRAVETLWAKRSVRGLVGNTINVDSGQWVRRDAGIGAGVDSFYEYLLKAYLAFGEPAYLEIFAEAYSAAQAQLALSPALNGFNWHVDVHMTTGRVLHPYVSSLAAFWPGMQVLIGQVKEAEKLHGDWAVAWERFKWIPEMFHLQLQQFHPTMTSYPLRPELAESTFLLYGATKDPTLLATAVSIHERLRDTTRGKCGHASISDVKTELLEDTMESFFLSETVKYLYLTISGATDIIDYFVFSTEGHLLPTFPAGSSNPSFQANEQSTLADSKDIVDSDLDKCAWLCNALPSHRAAKGGLLDVLPQLPVNPDTPARLRRRRCIACRAVAKSLISSKRRATLMWRSASETPQRAGRPHVAPPQWSLSRKLPQEWPFVVYCLLGPIAQKKLGCTAAKMLRLSELSSQATQVLPQNAVFFSLGASAEPSGREAVLEAMVHALAAVEVESQEQGKPSLQFAALVSEFGPDLLPGCNSSELGSIDRAQERWEEFLIEQENFTDWDLEEPSGPEETNEQVLERIAAAYKAQEKGAQEGPGSNKIQMRHTYYQHDNDLDEKVAQTARDTTEVDWESSHTSSTAPMCEASGILVLASPPDACDPLRNAVDLQDAIAVMYRGNCSFQHKVAAAEAAGAKGVVIVNNLFDRGLMPMGLDKAVKNPSIPAVLVRGTDGKLLDRAAEKRRHGRIWSPTEAVRTKLALEIELTVKTQESYLDSAGRGMCPAMQSVPELEMVVPANSNLWTLNQLYRLQQDLGPAFQVAASLLADGIQAAGESGE